MEKGILRILHTNDLHSQLENWPSVTAWLKKKREEYLTKGEDVLLFDIGDHADRSHLMTEGLQGKGNIVLLNKMDYNAVTIGNNEGITFSKEALNNLYNDATFSVILSNLYDEDGHHPNWCKPYEIITTPSGIKIGVTGVTIPYYTFYSTLGWEIEDPYESLEKIIQQLRPKVDILLCLSHLGFFEDERMAEKFPELDIILGAHTHHLLEEGKKVNNTWINQAGRSGKYVGDIKISFEKNKPLFDVKSKKVDVTIQDSETKEVLNQLCNEGEKELNKNIVYLNQPMKVNWYEETPLIKLLAEGLREWCDGDISMVNAGVLLDHLSKGTVSYKDIHRICPHPINPALVSISGEYLLEIIRQGKSSKMIEYPLKGFGFRGKILGEMIYDGLIIYNKSSYIQESDVFVQGEMLERQKEYQLATLDMFTLGKIYPAISSIKEKKYFMPELLRDILAWKLQKEDSLL
ncbi:bifunctional UDP-sugar hydrolase/5'-nucleotidase [Evansella sp. AB-P1]|uniref:bifunctional metallophosphatase/5'-nucleotidase n=1 Tax=Evansella sp. AB-P1 TaxID=3037653 RepID=UPI00241FABDC|nr:bifunctional UDP-sugar hydrolase/5'-nucleotidase [Evansella sp. AB-P1]MDG5788915.1 bifunctional UDP-sugar hydrolase/5'-nucleotidase [Evansella sp. AB-P1]